MQIGNRFIGRDREVAQLELMLGHGDDGLRFTHLTGPSGLGKTTLANVVIDRARNAGFCVALAPGRAGSLSTPFVPWIEALPGMAEVLAQPVVSSQNVDMEQLGTRLVAHLADVSLDEPLLLVFDDVQALDESSLALLPYATGISERANISFLFIEQSDAVGVPSSYRAFIDGLLARRVVQQLELGPMSDGSIRELVQAVLELDDAEAVPSEIIDRAEGNPWFAQELAHAWQRGEDDVPVNVAAAATARLNVLDDTGQDIVNAIAVCPEGAYIGWLEKLADQKPRQFVRTMESITHTGLVIEDGDFITISHPIYRQALVEDLSSAMRRALHQELADIIEETSLAEVVKARALGYHMSECGRSANAIESYLHSAEVNEVSGQLHEALADLLKALTCEERVEKRIQLLKRVAFAAAQLSDERAVDYWSDLGRLASAVGDNELYAYALFQQFWTSYEGTAVDRLERAVVLGVDTYGWSARAAAYLATIRGDFLTAIKHDFRALEIAEETGDTQLEVLALEKLGNNHAYVGKLPESIDFLGRAVNRAIAERYHSWAVFSWGAMSESLTENLDAKGSVQEAESALKYVDDMQLLRLRPLVLCWLALGLVKIGRISDAVACVQEAFVEEGRFSLTRDSALIASIRAQMVVESGDAINSATAIDEAFAMIHDQGVASWVNEISFAKARHCAQTGRAEDVMSIIDTICMDEPSLASSIGLWLARRGVLEERPEWLSKASEILADIPSDAPLVKLTQRSALATISAEASCDVTALRAIALEWADAGFVVNDLRTRLTAIVITLRSNQVSKEEIQEIKEIRASFVDAGAEFDANYVASLLRSLGMRSRAKSRTSTVGNLTKRELEIARLVASGMRNAEVADQLFLAEKTVAAHLSNIYGKLEVRSRVQLASWLQESDPEMLIS